MFAACGLCGRFFVSGGSRTCPSCLDRLDEVYRRAQEYLRDNPKMLFEAEALAQRLDADLRDILALASRGYFDHFPQKNGIKRKKTDSRTFAELEWALREIK